MANVTTIKINFKGGIISPGLLYNILVVASHCDIFGVSFGLRQQLLIEVPNEKLSFFTGEIQRLNIFYENAKDEFPNIMSSYPAEEVFINNTWLSEGVYKDIFDGIRYQPRLKINVSDCNQSFTPLLTGNINWVASSSAQHFWHLFIRFPQTNVIYEWDQLVYTNDVPVLSEKIESIILKYPESYVDNKRASGAELFSQIDPALFNTKPADKPAALPAFNLPYYEGLNRYNNNKYWLGIYRRDQLFCVDFLKEFCRLCLDTKIGQLCSTPWKTIIIKGIDEADRVRWNRLLEKHQVNVRHAANELNFQVEDNCAEGLALKNYLVRYLSREDMRTFGICFGIKTRRKSEVFCSILIRKRPLFSIGRWSFFHFYDVLVANNFNPNERTGWVFSTANIRAFLPEQMRRVVLAFYQQKEKDSMVVQRKLRQENATKPEIKEFVYQCRHCQTVYEEVTGDPVNDIAGGTRFNDLPEGYVCQLCESPKRDFVRREKNMLGLQAI
jgi:rubredoxin